MQPHQPQASIAGAIELCASVQCVVLLPGLYWTAMAVAAARKAVAMKAVGGAQVQVVVEGIGGIQARP